MGLRILERYAEKLKIEHGKATPDQGDEKEDVWMVGDLDENVEAWWRYSAPAVPGILWLAEELPKDGKKTKEPGQAPEPTPV